MRSDVGRKEYQLVVTDKEGKLKINHFHDLGTGYFYKTLSIPCRRKRHRRPSGCCSFCTLHAPYGGILHDLGHPVQVVCTLRSSKA